MTTRTIHRAQTHVIDRSVPDGDTLRIQGGFTGGGAGGEGILSGTLTNAGTIEILGGLASASSGVAGGQGGTLLLSGQLTSSGAISIDAGRALYSSKAAGGGGVLDSTGTLDLTATSTLRIGGGYGGIPGGAAGGTLINDGVLTNAGLIMLQGGDTGFYPDTDRGRGAVLTNDGTLANSGTLVVGGGVNSGYFYADGGLGATLTDTGTITNTGLIQVLGGAGGGYIGRGGTGGTLAVEGVLTNAGTIELGGGAPPQGVYGYEGDGGVLLLAGSLVNTGLLTLDAGYSIYSGKGGAQLVITESRTGSALTNSGTIEVHGGVSLSPTRGFAQGGTITVYRADLNNNAMLLIDGGGGGLAPAYGGIANFGGNVAVGYEGRVTNTGTIIVGGGGAGIANASGSAGGTLSLLADTHPFGVTEIDNQGVLIVQAGAAANAPGAYGETAAGRGGLLMVGASTQFSDEGTVLLQGGSTGTGGGGGGQGAQMVVDDAVVFLGSHGTLTVGASQGGSAATLSLNNARVELDRGSLIENDGVMTMAGNTVITDGTLQNNGTLAGSGYISGATIVNDGVIQVTELSMKLGFDKITTDAGAHGVLLVSPGGVLNVGGSTLDTNQTVQLAGPGAVVAVYAKQAGIALQSSGGVMDIQGGGTGTLAASDTQLTVFLFSPTSLTLSQMAFVTAVGSSGADTITALAAGQTLTGGGGTDHLFGAAATGDTFLDTAAGLNTDIIGGFAGTDAIDITNIAAAGATLAYTQGSGQGTLTVANGGTSTSITLLGTFTAGSFATGSDGHSGVLVTLHG